MNKKNCNSDVYLLVLSRPADPVCATLSAFLSQERYMFSISFSVYQTLRELEAIPDYQTVILIAPGDAGFTGSVIFCGAFFESENDRLA